MVDQVKVAAAEEATSEQSLRRNLTNRHIQLIAIGGAIGTGLFMGSGKTISLAGPSIIFVYMIIGFMLFFVMRAMGELLLSNLEYKSFSDFASDLLGPWAGYFTGWTYWFCWVVTGMADVVAITAYAQFWFPGLSDWVASLAVIVLLLSLNLATVKMFGEMEFWFAMIKIVAIIALIVVGLVMVLTHFQSPTGVQAWLAICGMTAAGSRKVSAASLPASRLRCLRLSGLSWSVPRRRKPKIRRNPCRARSTPFRCVSSCSTCSR